MNHQNQIQKVFVFMVMGISLLTMSVFIPIPIHAASYNTTLPTMVSPEYEVQILVPGGHFHGIHGLTFDSQDNIYVGSLIVAEMGTGNLLKVTGEKEEDRKIIATELAAPTWLAPAGPGAVYVAEFMTGTISRIDLASGEKKVVVSGLSGPEGFAVKPDGKFVVVEEKTRQLVEVDLASGAHTPLVVNLEIGSPAFPGGAPFGNVASVAVSESGVIYLTADINNAIYKISPK